MLTAEKLRELLDYDPMTGVFTWRAKEPVTAALRAWNTKWAGKAAGSTKAGRIKIKISGIFYRAHRLAWLYVYGQWPEGLLDHRDQDDSNNRIRNLRSATNAQNVVNSPPRRTGTSGARGVTWNKRARKWQAAICVSGKSLYLGCYAEKADAAEAFANAAALHYGEFAPHFESRSLLFGSSAVLPAG